MADIVISISQENLEIILNLISIFFFAVGIFLLSWIKKNISENLSKTFTYLIISIAGAIVVKLLVLLANIGLIGNFIYEAFIAIPAFFFLLGIISFYKSVVKEIKPPARRVHHRVHHRSVRKR